MNIIRLAGTGSAIMALALAMTISMAEAQTTQPRAARAQARTTRVVPPANPVVAQAPVQPEIPCLKTLSGECVNPVVVEAVRIRAEIIPAETVSYFGTPAGTIGGDYIPFERLFQDDPLRYGLPTVTLINPGCCIKRTK